MPCLLLKGKLEDTHLGTAHRWTLHTHTHTGRARLRKGTSTREANKNTLTVWANIARRRKQCRRKTSNSKLRAVDGGDGDDGCGSMQTASQAGENWLTAQHWWRVLQSVSQSVWWPVRIEARWQSECADAAAAVAPQHSTALSLVIVKIHRSQALHVSTVPHKVQPQSSAL